MMDKYSTAMPAAIAAGRQPWLQIQKWVDKFVCGVHRSQGVVGNRDHPDGGKVTQAQFDTCDKVAQVCPFVKDSLELDYFYIEESAVSELADVKKILLSLVAPFKSAEPAHDPIALNGPARMPTALKTFLIFFPNYKSPVGAKDMGVERLYRMTIMSFVREGLMLGQFNRGYQEPAIHNPEWMTVLTSPYLAFVVRYMQPHDKVFILPEMPGWPIYKRLFPEHAH